MTDKVSQRLIVVTKVAEIATIEWVRGLVMAINQLTNDVKKEVFMVADVLLTHFNQLFCLNDPGHPLTGQEMKKPLSLKMAI